MRVSLIKNNKIKNFILPEKIIGNYWITDFDVDGNERNLINIEAKNNQWYLVSNDDVFIVDNNNARIPYVNLKNYSFYSVSNDIDKNVLLLYCSPVYETNLNCYNISDYKNKEFNIGRSDKCDLIYNSTAISDNQAILLYNGQNFIIMDDHSDFGIYVNNIRIKDSKVLEIGDSLFIMGLKIVILLVDGQPHLIVNNPNNLVQCKLLAQGLPSEIDNSFTEADEDVEVNFYDQDDYFHKKPRFIYNTDTYELKIDSPPAKEKDQETPILLTIGPMLTMSMTSVVMGYVAINNVLKNNASWDSAIPSLVISGAMIASVALWPIFTKKYNARKKIRDEKKRQEKYSEYIEGKRKKINEELLSQKANLINSFLKISECLNVILKKQTNLWEKRIEDKDFLTVCVGYGTMPMKIDIKYPEEHFTMDDDNLMDIVNKLGSEPKNLVDVPIPFSFIDDKIGAIVGSNDDNKAFIDNILLQIMAFHSYDDLKIVMFTNKENEHLWQFLKILPHCWSDDKSLRFFATENDEYRELCYNLDHIFSKRKEDARDHNDNDPHKYKQLYLIITDSFRSIRNFDFIKNVLDSKNNLGFGMLILTDKIVSLPDQCQTFVELNGDKGKIFKNIANNDSQEFIIDLSNKYDIYKCSQTLSNIPIEFKNDENGQIPNKLGFLEMYDVGKVEQLNSLNRWIKNTPILNMQAPVGMGKSGEKISLDLHEKYHGPHGLIAGMTGSGKSEFIISYILSMAINYHPYEVQFILIDYKGGGLAGAFENQTTGLKLPHLIGTITNLDTNEIKRSLASVESELKRRQKAFNKAREISGESTIDIYKYQKMYREKIIDEPVSHLIIIADEFAELKQQQPEFMEQLISTARIGRSLGVHLILATQKPSGVVDPQIWSNTRFRVCLRVQEKSDSQEVIKSSDAALLKQTGRFYLQVGFNEIYVLGQAAWAGGKYFPSEKIKRSIDTSILFIDNIGYPIKNIETKKKADVAQAKGEELINILQYLANIAKQENINCRPLWLERIPNYITIDDLIKKYNYQKENCIINPVIGEYDIPDMQEQHLLTIPLSKEGNAIVYGAAGSGKENFITTMIYSSMLYYSPTELNYYILDFGAEVLRCFTNSPLVGDIVYIQEAEKVKNLFKMINKTINERKKLFANYNGDYYNYCKNSGSIVQSIVVVINNYEAYQETYATYDDELIVLTRDCSKYGVYFVLTASTPNGLRFKLKQNFSQNFVLQQNNDDDYTTILGNIHKNYPSKAFGRGIIRKDGIHEFQTAFVTEKDEISNYVRNKSQEFCSKYPNRAPKIPVLPEVVTEKDIINEFGKSEEFIIGIDKNELQIVKYNFIKNFATIITAMDIDVTAKFANALINQIIRVNKSSLIVINAEEYNLNEVSRKYYSLVNNNFDDIYAKLEKYVKDNNDLYVKNNYNRNIFNNVKPLICIVIGADSFKNKLNATNKTNFGNIFELAKDLGIISYIFIDSIDKIKKIEMESWYKAIINTSEGLWFGNGINDQFSLKIMQRTNEMREEIPDNFCFVVKRGKPVLVKYVEQFDLNTIKRD